jgi:hypothetical protein
MPKNRKQKQRKQRSMFMQRTSTGTTESSAIVVTNNARLKHVIGVLPRGASMFPDELITQGKVIVQYASNVSSGPANNFLTFVANGVMSNYGPSFNGGTFAINVPSGCDSLLSAARGPYTRCWTLETKINLQMTANSSGQAYVTFLPTTNSYGTISSLSSSQLGEQRGAVQVLIPPSNDLPVTLNATFNPWDIFGVDRKTYMSVPDYGQPVLTQPNNLSYFHIIHTGGTGSIVAFIITIEMRFKFAELQVMATTQPS